MSILLRDTFVLSDTGGSTTISNAAGWGPSTDGSAWTSSGAAPTWSIASKQGKVTGVTADTFALLSANSYGDSEGLVRLSSSSIVAGNWLGLILRYSSTTAFYSCSLKGGNTIQIRQHTTSLGTATFNYSANTEYWMRFRAKGTSFYGKAWADGTAEPSAWTLGPFSDATIASGKAGIYFSPAATGTIALFDNFSVNDTLPGLFICDGLGGVFS